MSPDPTLPPTGVTSSSVAAAGSACSCSGSVPCWSPAGRCCARDDSRARAGRRRRRRQAGGDCWRRGGRSALLPAATSGVAERARPARRAAPGPGSPWSSTTARTAASMVACSPSDVPTGLDALEAAGFSWVGTTQFWSFVCRINGLPTPDDDPCVRTPPADAYWSYWTAPRGGSWSYESQGPATADPAPGRSKAGRSAPGHHRASHRPLRRVEPPTTPPPPHRHRRHPRPRRRTSRRPIPARRPVRRRRRPASSTATSSAPSASTALAAPSRLADRER